MGYWNDKLRALADVEDVNRALRWEKSELDPDFLCFAGVYGVLSEVIPKDMIVVDFGCYAGLQGYFFKDHPHYIGIDKSEVPTPQNLENGEFIKKDITDYCKSIDGSHFKFLDQKTFAILSYVNDTEAVETVRKMFSNVACYYPGEKNTIRMGNRETDWNPYTVTDLKKLTTDKSEFDVKRLNDYISTIKQGLGLVKEYEEEMER